VTTFTSNELTRLSERGIARVAATADRTSRVHVARTDSTAMARRPSAALVIDDLIVDDPPAMAPGRRRCCRH
jgi:hypothetical protein